jgi:ribosome-associated protein
LKALQDAYRALDQKFGQDIVMMDVRALTTVADYFIIATGGSRPQIQALALAAEESLGKNGYALRHSEGLRSANWALLDFGDIIVHLFDKESRNFYNLERVWGDAKLIQTAS